MHARALIGGSHFVGHILAGKLGQRMGGGDFHGVIDGPRAHIKRAPEYIGKAQNVVDLICIVRPARGHDGIGPHPGHILRRDLGIGIRHGKNDRVLRHGFHHGRRQRARNREAEENIGAFNGVGQGSCFRWHGMGGFPLVHAIGAALVNHAFRVREDDVFMRHAQGLDQFDAGDGGGARPVAHELEIFEIAARQFQRVDQRGSRDDRRAVLVVVEHRDVHELAQALLDDEAIRRLDVLEIDAAKGGAEIAHGADEFLDVFRIHFKIDGIDIGKAFEEHGLAFHHRLRGERAQIAQAEDGRAIGDHRDEIALGRVVIGRIRILRDGAHRHGNAGAIGK